LGGQDKENQKNNGKKRITKAGEMKKKATSKKGKMSIGNRNIETKIEKKRGETRERRGQPTLTSTSESFISGEKNAAGNEKMRGTETDKEHNKVKSAKTNKQRKKKNIKVKFIRRDGVR